MTTIQSELSIRKSIFILDTHTYKTKNISKIMRRMLMSYESSSRDAYETLVCKEPVKQNKCRYVKVSLGLIKQLCIKIK